jgi:hypothetical protein
VKPRTPLSRLAFRKLLYFPLALRAFGSVRERSPRRHGAARVCNLLATVFCVRAGKSHAILQRVALPSPRAACLGMLARSLRRRLLRRSFFALRVLCWRQVPCIDWPRLCLETRAMRYFRETHGAHSCRSRPGANAAKHMVKRTCFLERRRCDKGAGSATI